MPTMTKHAPGTFCWAELATSNQDKAKAFYSSLFDWTINDMPLGPGETYTMLQLGGRDAAALYTLDPRHTPPGTPPNWLAYLATDDVEASAKAVAAHGGTVLKAPFDVMDAGRMAVCQDPLGAVFAIWQAGRSPGLGVKDEPGSLGWCQLNASDPAKAVPFYSGVFGWSARQDAMPQGGAYTTFLSGTELRGGGMPMPPGVNAPAHWLIYFAVADVDAATARAKALGGMAMVEPMDIPGSGRFAVLQDPQGASFAVVRFAM